MKLIKYNLIFLAVFSIYSCAFVNNRENNLDNSIIGFDDRNSELHTETHDYSQDEISEMKTVLLQIEEISLSVNNNICLNQNFPGTYVLVGKNDVKYENCVFSHTSEEGYSIIFMNNGISELYKKKEISEFEYIYNIFEEDPDKKKIAFTNAKTTDSTSEVYIYDSSGSNLGQITLPNNWTMYKWLDGENLQVRQYRSIYDQIENSPGLLLIDSKGVIIDVLSSNFPRIYRQENFLTWGDLTIFNQQKNLVLFPEREYNPSQLYSILWDVNTNSEIIRIINGEWPQWSKDGEIILIVVDKINQLHEYHDEIWIFNSLGDELYKTDFSQKYTNVKISHPNWSPDGTKIAFYFNTDPLSDYFQLAIMDFELETVYEYDNRFVPYSDNYGSFTLGNDYIRVNSQKPIWSPDSNYVVVENQTVEGYDNLLFDIKNKQYMQITKNVKIVGWLQ